jgi:Phage baseplate assembly protein W
MTLRGIRFGGVAIDGSPVGLTVTTKGSVATVEGDECVRQALMMLLSTVPGERLLRPDYGCDLYRLVFAPNDQTTAGLAIHYVRQAVQRWEPRVEIVALDAEADPYEPSILTIRLTYRVRASLSVATLTIPLDLAGTSPGGRP